MAHSRDGLENLERRRADLEQNVARLQASLLHWQAWEIVYEGLKEEILALGKAPTSQDLERIADHDEIALSGTPKPLLTRMEKLNVFKTEKGAVRNQDQIASLLSRRVDYVQQNIKTSASLLRSAEERLLSAEVLREAKALNEDGLPVTEIHEEIDDDGNILFSSTSLPGQQEAEAVESIEQGAKDVAVEEGGVKQLHEARSDASNRPAIEGKATESLAPSRDFSAKKAELSKKKVSFEDGVLDRPASRSLDLNDESSVRKVEPPRNLEPSVSDLQDAPALEKASYHKAREQDLLNEISDREADEYERQAMAQSVIPEDESPEDATLRRQMIQYNMDEIGAVVAEIDLEDDNLSISEYDSETLLDNIDEDDDKVATDEDEDEQEDAFGRTFKQRPLDEAYVNRMQALSERLKAETMINMGPEHPTRIGKNLPIPSPGPDVPKTQRPPAKKKGVRFAKQLDIQEAPEISVANLLAASSAMTGTPIATPPTSSQRVASSVETSSDIEKPESGTEKKISKFKAARSQAANNASIARTMNVSNPVPKPSPDLPDPPASRNPRKILADTLVERPFQTQPEVAEAGTSQSSSPSSAALANEQTNEDDLDVEHNGSSVYPNQISTEYQRLRTRQLQREGGFVGNEEDNEHAEVLLAEEEGGPKRMSRFRAARLGLR